MKHTLDSYGISSICIEKVSSLYSITQTTAQGGKQAIYDLALLSCLIHLPRGRQEASLLSWGEPS